MKELNKFQTHQVVIPHNDKNSNNIPELDVNIITFLDTDGNWKTYEILNEKPKKSWILSIFHKLTRYKR